MTIALGLDANNPTFANSAYVPSEDANSVTVFDTSNNTVVTTVPVGHFPFPVAVSADGTTAYIGNYGDGTISVIDTATNLVSMTISVGIPGNSGLGGLALSPDGGTLYIAANDTLYVVDTSNGTLITKIVLADGSYAINPAVSADGGKVYLTTGDTGIQSQGTVAIIDASTNTLVNTVITGEGFTDGIAISPDGNSVWVTGEGNCNGACQGVSVIDTNTLAVTNLSWGNVDAPNHIAMSPDGATAYVQSWNCGFEVVDTSDVTDISNGIVAVVEPACGPQSPGGSAVSPNGNQLYYIDTPNNQVLAFDAKTLEVTAQIPVSPTSVALGNFVAPKTGANAERCSAQRTVAPRCKSALRSTLPGSSLRLSARGLPQALATVPSPLRDNAKFFAVAHQALAQPSSKTCKSPCVGVQPAKGSITLWDQNSDATGVGTNSQTFESTLFQYDAAGSDDFAVPGGSVWIIREVDVTGLYYKHTGAPASSEDVIFYRDRGGRPGGTLMECTNLNGTDSGGSFAIVLPKSCLTKFRGGASGATYWISVVAHCAVEDGCGGWGWGTRNGQSGNSALWNNPGNGFRTRCKKWSDMRNCIGQFGEGPDYMFALQGVSKTQ